MNSCEIGQTKPLVKWDLHPMRLLVMTVTIVALLIAIQIVLLPQVLNELIVF